MYTINHQQMQRMPAGTIFYEIDEYGNKKSALQIIDSNKSGTHAFGATEIIPDIDGDQYSWDWDSAVGYAEGDEFAIFEASDIRKMIYILTQALYKNKGEM